MKGTCMIIGPYRANTHHEVHLNIERSKKFAKALWALGYATVCPHTNTAFFSGICEEENFLIGYQMILKKMDFIFIIPHEKSEGSAEEIKLADRLGVKEIPLGDAIKIMQMCGEAK